MSSRLRSQACLVVFLTGTSPAWLTGCGDDDDGGTQSGADAGHSSDTDDQTPQGPSTDAPEMPQGNTATSGPGSGPGQSDNPQPTPATPQPNGNAGQSDGGSMSMVGSQADGGAGGAATVPAAGEAGSGNPGPGDDASPPGSLPSNAPEAGVVSSPPESSPGTPLVSVGDDYLGFPERFNRYYTDPSWQPSTTLYVSPDGNGAGLSESDPASVDDALATASAGTRVVFTAGSYDGCFELDSDHNGTYDAPIVLYGARAEDGSLAVTISCCDSGRQTCINLEGANYVAVDGFELVGGVYGVRAVGLGYGADEHQRGTAVLNCVGHGQDRDPFFSGQSDWLVLEHSTAYDSGEGDGHGIYLSNGSDWNIVRYNETYDTVSSDFQINADPNSTCADEGIAFDDVECDAVAGSDPTGGRGASDFFVVESNFFHHSLAQGPNFTSVRNSVVRNNILAFQARHGASFWQETDNPRLGSSNNRIVHNLFITTIDDRQALGITNFSSQNRVENNVFAALSAADLSANSGGQLLATDASTVADNEFVHNAWLGGYLGSDDDADPYTPNAEELQSSEFDPAWFAALSAELGHDPHAFAPSGSAPWLDYGDVTDSAPSDWDGTLRQAPVDLGPFERTE